ncbi:hypothetical protein DMC01_01915 [Campylobacter troglodytis]|nr:hypothetical protein DMC01_01915 [Campylobacter troglodytis]
MYDIRLLKLSVKFKFLNLKGKKMRFLILFLLSLTFSMADALPKPVKPYIEKAPKIELSGELLFRYEKHSGNNKNSIPRDRGSKGSLSISVE